MVNYEKPKIVDYGTLLELTLGGTMQNADTPTGNNNAWPNYTPS